VISEDPNLMTDSDHSSNPEYSAIKCDEVVDGDTEEEMAHQ
jgi:hypothetical protein